MTNGIDSSNKLAQLLQRQGIARTQKTTVTAELAETQQQSTTATQQARTDLSQQQQSIQTQLQASAANVASAMSTVQTAAANLVTANANVASAASALAAAQAQAAQSGKDGTAVEAPDLSSYEAVLNEALVAQAQAQTDLDTAQTEYEEAKEADTELKTTTQQELENSKTATEEEKQTYEQARQEQQQKVDDIEAQLDSINAQIEQAKAQAQKDQENKDKNGNPLTDYQIAEGVATYTDASGKKKTVDTSNSEDNTQVIYNDDGSVTRVVTNADGTVTKTKTTEKNGKFETTQVAQTEQERNEAAIEETQAAAQKEEDENIATTVGSVEDASFYDDDKTYSASEAFSMVAKNSDIFVGDYSDDACAINGIEKILKNTDWKVEVNGESVPIQDAIANSFDSELDLYIEDALQEIISEQNAQGLGATTKFENSGFLSEESLKKLAAKGIRVDALCDSDGTATNRVYSFSLVEVPDDVDDVYDWMYNTDEGKNANVIEDSNGKKGSIIMSDCVIPDGFYQGAEINFSSILDLMGYDCISKADFLDSNGNFNKSEYESVISEVETRLNNGEYKAGDETMDNLYGSRKTAEQSRQDLWAGYSSIPGYDWSTVSGGSGSSNADKLLNGSSGSSSSSGGSDSAASYDDIKKTMIASYKQQNGTDPTGAALRAITDAAYEQYKDQF